MSITKYGIYIAYPPTVQLRHEGLGRYLLSFLQSGANRSDIRFVVACPSWFKNDFLELCKTEGVSIDSFDLLTPARIPSILRIYELYHHYKRRPKRIRNKRLSAFVREKIIHHRNWIGKKMVTSRHLTSLVPIITYVALLQCIVLPVYFISKISVLTRYAIQKWISPYLNKWHAILSQPKNNLKISRLYRFMEQSEIELMLNQINRCQDIKAWYCHTAFWPSFNRITGPRLMCVPDVVLSEFPVAFSEIGGDRFLENFNAVEQAIAGGTHFVTYSDQIKRETLIKKYSINPSMINVIRHAPNDLSHWINIKGYIDNEAATRNYCQLLLMSSLQKSSHPDYSASFFNKTVKYLFYASQFRPSKNVITLLHAYEYLLRKRYISHKLILTGDPATLPIINDFIIKHNLKNEVLCLHGLTSAELAACYKLADLAVNPSLSEGACPFTLTEALSVDTPVVMSQIPVTDEIIKEDLLRNKMLFDPYDWKSMANCIEWALENRAWLLAHQQEVYDELSQRSWSDVVDEHIAVLERISAGKFTEINSHIEFDTNNCKLDIKALDKPFIFMHIPKTAGTSFINYLSANLPANKIAPPFMRDIPAQDINNETFRLYWGHVTYEMVREIKKDLYILTFLRDPLTRVISQYKSWHNSKNLTEKWLSIMSADQIEALHFSQSATLDEFILSDHPHIIGNLRDLQTRYLADVQGTATMLESAMHNLSENIYFFGIMERFNDSIALFRNLFANTVPYALSPIQENRSSIIVPPISKQALERVKELNQNDYQLYEFALKRFDEILKMRTLARKEVA